MMRFIMPAVLVGIAITVFFMFTDPIYTDTGILRTEVASYNEALNNSKILENERDKLTAKFNTIDPDNILKLQKFLPENVDNIRLILEIEKIASPYGMVLKNVRYNATNTNVAVPVATTPETQVSGAAVVAPSNYEVFDLEFSTSGSYSDFVSFTKDIESNLRMVDISSIDFSSDASNANSKTASSEIYSYNFKIRTYYFKQ